MINLNELEKLARAATPGPWGSENYGGIGPRSTEDDQSYGMISCVAYVRGSDFDNEDNNKSFIAAANPAAILELIENYRDLVGQVSSLCTELDACQKVIHYAGGFDPAYVNGAQEALKSGRLAIARASGESNE